MNLSEILNKVLCGGELAPGEQQMLAEILKTDPDLARSLFGWQQVRDYLQDRIPDSQDMVLHALVSGGHAEDLDDEEASDISENWKKIDSVVEAHPGFSDVSAQIIQDRQDFLACWEAHESQPVRRLPSWTYRIAAAIAVLSVCIVAAIFLLNQEDRALQVATVPPGEYQRILLPDSSIAHLSGPARLQYNDQEFGRNVELTGKAFFEVNTQLVQFTVETSEAVTRALGTRFSVRSHNHVTQVVLESGQVEVVSGADSSQSVTLLPGQMTSITRGATAPAPPSEANLGEELLWTGFIFFRETPMRKAVVILSFARDVRVEVDPLLMNEDITGTFAPDVSSEDIVSALALALNAQIFQEGDTFRIAP